MPKTKRPIKFLISRLVNSRLRAEFKQQQVKRLNERPIEFSFAFSMVRKSYPRNVLDVGTGTTAFPHLLRNCGMRVTAIDNVTDYWPSGMFNRHWYVIDDDITNPNITETFDMVFCISTLEHIRNSYDAMKNMSQLLCPMGKLVLTFPSSPKPYVQNCYDLPGSSYGRDNPYVAQSFDPSQIDDWTDNFGLEEIESEYWRFWTGDYWTCGSQVCPPQRVGPSDIYNLRCVCFSKR